MRKGFSIFTPMVGTLVILITMLIVSSIILSEKVAVQGSVKSYRSSELVNIAAEAQSRVIEEVRNTITSRLEGSGETEPVVSIVVNDCPSAAVAEAHDYPDPECDGGDCVCSDSGDTSCNPEDTCWANAISQVNLTASNELASKALLQSSIQHTISTIVNKYALTNITAKNAPLSDIVKGISFIDCTASENLGDCPDGRLKIDVDFTPLKDTPIAEVSSKGKRLQVFMPAEERTYTTHEPFMQYAVLTASLFQNFQLLNNSWHNAGNIHNHNGYDSNDNPTNGSEWYQYNYVEHQRYYGNPGSVGIATAWAPGFVEDDPDSYFADGKDLSSYIMDNVITGPPNDPQQPDALRFDTTYPPELTNFVSGYATIGVGTGYPTLGIGADPQTGTIFPGGCIEPDGAGGCTRMGTTGNCLANDDNFGPLDNYLEPGGTTLVNTTADYDKKFDGMGKMVEDLATNVRSNSAILAGFGISDKDNLNYKLVVTSNQYYLEEAGFKGKDNWHCGQFMMLYQTTPPLSQDEIDAAGASNACEAARIMWDCGGQSNPSCVAGVCNICTVDDTGNCPWFISEPVNWTCDAKTLYRVEEKYRIYRSNATSAEPTRVVFAAQYTRKKKDYEDLQDTSLWNQNGRYSDIVSGDDIKGSWATDVSHVRHCVYEYSTTDQEFVKNCEWKSAEDLPTL